MNVSFSIGPKSQAVINTLSKSADHVEFFTFDNLDTLVKDSTLRHLKFDRIVFSSAILKKPDKEFERLNQYIKEHSPSTEIVFIMQKDNNSGLDNIFKRYFNAPMYTPVCIAKATSQSLLEVVLGEIGDLRSKYYENTGSSDSSGNSSSGESSYQVNNNSVNNTGDSASGERSGWGSGPASVYNGYSGSSGLSSDSVGREMYENSSIQNNGYPVDYENSSEEEDLGLGEFGEEHSDTGFLDSEDDEELRRLFEEESSKGESSESIIPEKDEVEELDSEVPPVTPTVPNKQQREKEKEAAIDRVNKEVRGGNTISTDLNIDLVVSTRGARSTQEIIDEALNLFRKDSARILIIDLDYKENRILSLVDTDNFYTHNCQEGITKQRVYTEDHIDICSNGYTVPITTKDLKALLASKMIRKYELILIDCPVDCLDVIDEEIIKMCHVLVFSGKSKNDLVEMSIGLTNRNVVSLAVEKYIMRNCEVDSSEEINKTDIKYMLSKCIFANGNWLERIDN